MQRVPSGMKTSLRHWLPVIHLSLLSPFRVWQTSLTSNGCKRLAIENFRCWCQVHIHRSTWRIWSNTPTMPAVTRQHIRLSKDFGESYLNLTIPESDICLNLSPVALDLPFSVSKSWIRLSAFKMPVQTTDFQPLAPAWIYWNYQNSTTKTFYEINWSMPSNLERGSN